MAGLFLNVCHLVDAVLNSDSVIGSIFPAKALFPLPVHHCRQNCCQSVKLTPPQTQRS